MSTDSVLNEETMSASPLADVTDDSCVVKYIEIVPLTRDTDGAYTTEFDSGDWSAQVSQEHLPVVKQEPQDVCCIHYMSCVHPSVVCLSVCLCIMFVCPAQAIESFRNVSRLFGTLAISDLPIKILRRLS